MLVKSDYENISVNFSLKSKAVPPPHRDKKSKFSSSSRLSNIVSENLHISGTVVARANPKTVFEKEN